MNYQELLQPIEFSALYQLVFTLYAAYIVVEYAKSFTAQVINHFYNFKEEIDLSIERIIVLCRKEEMQSIESDDYFMKGEGLCLVDKYYSKIKKCNNKAKEIKEELYDYVDQNTEYRIFRYLSMMMMLYGLTMLVAAGFFNSFPSQTIHFLMTFITLVLLFMVVAWVFAVTRPMQNWSDKRSFRVVFGAYILFIVLSLLSIFFFYPFELSVKERVWTSGLLLSILFPFLNFLFFFVLVTSQMKKISKHCEDSYVLLDSDCKEAGDLMSKMLSHQEMRNVVDEYKNKERKVDNDHGNI